MASINHETVVTATATATTVINRNDRRCFLMIQNQGAEPVRVAFYLPATGTTGIKLFAGATFTADSVNCPQNAISIIRDATATGNVSVYIAEGS